MNAIPIRVRTKERVKILSVDTDVSVKVVIQEYSARLVSSMINTFHRQIDMVNYYSLNIINHFHASKGSPFQKLFFANRTICLYRVKQPSIVPPT